MTTLVTRWREHSTTWMQNLSYVLQYLSFLGIQGVTFQWVTGCWFVASWFNWGQASQLKIFGEARWQRGLTSALMSTCWLMQQRAREFINCQDCRGLWFDVDTSCDGWQRVTSDVLSGHADHTDLTDCHTVYTDLTGHHTGHHTVYTGHTGRHADLRR